MSGLPVKESTIRVRGWWDRFRVRTGGPARALPSFRTDDGHPGPKPSDSVTEHDVAGGVRLSNRSAGQGG